MNINYDLSASAVCLDARQMKYVPNENTLRKKKNAVAVDDDECSDSTKCDALMVRLRVRKKNLQK